MDRDYEELKDEDSTIYSMGYACGHAAAQRVRCRAAGCGTRGNGRCIRPSCNHSPGCTDRRRYHDGSQWDDGDCRTSGESNAPYDAQFIDSMIEHHQGAIDMANQALKEASRPELKTLAQNIITAQEAEIKQMQDWRKAWYPDLAATGGMGMDMGDMEVSGDTTVPFDQRFITAMIAHHQGAIAMAKDAEQKAEHSEIKTLAQTIISAQESEITQMQQWQQEWFGQ
jgi:uncharacterized protein (DUF305 family)